MKDLKYVCVAEEWRDIPDFEGYQVSSFGRVRAIIAGKSWKFNVTDILRRDERRKPIVII
jgi:hypothetical protein